MCTSAPADIRWVKAGRHGPVLNASAPLSRPATTTSSSTPTGKRREAASSSSSSSAKRALVCQRVRARRVNRKLQNSVAMSTSREGAVTASRRKQDENSWQKADACRGRHPGRTGAVRHCLGERAATSRTGPGRDRAAGETGQDLSTGGKLDHEWLHRRRAALP